MNDIFSFKIVKHIGIISENDSNWSKELNLVSWNGKEPCFDIRLWSPAHDKMSRGITLSEDEMDKLYSVLMNEYFFKEDNR